MLCLHNSNFIHVLHNYVVIERHFYLNVGASVLVQLCTETDTSSAGHLPDSSVVLVLLPVVV